MTVLSIILLVLFVIVSLALIFMVCIQSEDNNGLSGLFGGQAGEAFGGNTNAVINKITAILVAAFIVLAILLAIVYKSSDTSLIAAAKSV